MPTGDAAAADRRRCRRQHLKMHYHGDVRASGGSVLLVPMITLCTGDLEECVRGAAETGELLLSSVANALRQRDLELYVVTKTHGH